PRGCGAPRGAPRRCPPGSTRPTSRIAGGGAPPGARPPPRPRRAAPEAASCSPNEVIVRAFRKEQDVPPGEIGRAWPPLSSRTSGRSGTTPVSPWGAGGSRPGAGERAVTRSPLARLGPLLPLPVQPVAQRRQELVGVDRLGEVVRGARV